MALRAGLYGVVGFSGGAEAYVGVGGYGWAGAGCDAEDNDAHLLGSRGGMVS